MLTGGEGEEGPPYVPPQKTLKMDYKIAIKHENRVPLSRFSLNPKSPSQKNLKMAVHL
jgi:hypothetical protein